MKDEYLPTVGTLLHRPAGREIGRANTTYQPTGRTYLDGFGWFWGARSWSGSFGRRYSSCNLPGYVDSRRPIRNTYSTSRRLGWI